MCRCRGAPREPPQGRSAAIRSATAGGSCRDTRRYWQPTEHGTSERQQQVAVGQPVAGIGSEQQPDQQDSQGQEHQQAAPAGGGEAVETGVGQAGTDEHLQGDQIKGETIDGGGAGDQHGIAGNAQNLATWLGKILRIDIDGQAPYQVPADNPFVKDKNAKPEIWAYGLRNPWKFSFDESTGALWCGDVGQNTYEEIDKIEKGKNYGWRIQEAMHCFNPASDCKTAGLTPPLAEYNRTIGYCVIGGYLYRGKAIPTLKGKYIFGDWKGALFYLDEEHANYSMQYVLCSEKGTNETGFHINAMGRDSQGEIYVIGQKIIGTVFATGVVYKVIP